MTSNFAQHRSRILVDHEYLLLDVIELQSMLCLAISWKNVIVPWDSMASGRNGKQHVTSGSRSEIWRAVEWRLAHLSCTQTRSRPRLQQSCMTSTLPAGPWSEPSSDPAKESEHDWPSNWPDDGTVFLTDQTYSDAVTEELKTALGRTTGEFSTYPRIAPATLSGRCPLEIHLIVDKKHPAAGQRGLFARFRLEPDMFLCLYLGHVHTNSLSDTDPRSDYDLSLDRELGLSVDAARSGNESRCANDYRGIAERPNAEFRDCLIKVACSKRKSGTKWERRVGIFVLSAGKAGKRKAGILAGEEVLVSYGKGFWESRQLMGKFRKDFEMLNVATAALNA